MNNYDNMIVFMIVIIKNIKLLHVIHNIQKRDHVVLQIIKYFNIKTQYRVNPEQ